MKTLRLAIIAAVLLLTPVVFGQVVAPPISGIVHSVQHGPLAGATVSLVHPAVGRSTPAFTGPGGGYFFTNVPPRSDAYYIEAYWGNQLLYRNTLVYTGAPVRFDIQLP